MGYWKSNRVSMAKILTRRGVRKSKQEDINRRTVWLYLLCSNKSFIFCTYRNVKHLSKTMLSIISTFLKITILILKPDRDPKSLHLYHPISLISVLGKHHELLFMERVWGRALSVEYTNLYNVENSKIVDNMGI